MPGAAQVGELDLVGPDQTGAFDVDQVARAQVLPQQHFASPALEAAQELRVAVELRTTAGQGGHLACMDELVLAGDVDHEARYRRVAPASEPSDHVDELPGVAAIGAGHRRAQQARQVELGGACAGSCAGVHLSSRARLGTWRLRLGLRHDVTAYPFFSP